MARKPTLTLEKKLERQRERWRKKQARRRKETADSQWLRATRQGYFEKVEVLHWARFVEYLLWQDFLAEEDVEVIARIDAATDDLLAAYIRDWTERWGWDSHGWLAEIKHERPMPNPNFRSQPGDGIGKVRVKVSMALVEVVGLEHECDNRSKIRRRIEELLFAIYSNLAHRDLYDPWPTTGRQNTRPIFSPLQSHKKEYLHGIGKIDHPRRGTRFRQDAWLHPQDHEHRKPGAMFGAGGEMPGKRKRLHPALMDSMTDGSTTRTKDVPH